mmetsp:Transcript_68731/g.136164  ORF Transcript_68731/g.136164 Transcript_68731/m.136164 type:complete len:587 (-) Transcript_68731:286-2046(-)
MSPAPTGAIVWLHDLGERDATEFAKVASPAVPWLNVHCPAAPPVQFAGQAQPAHGQWFAHKEIRSAKLITESPEGLRDSIKYVHERLDYIQSTLKLDSSRILLGGFGQGGALAIAAGLAYSKPLCAIATHSGYVCEPAGELQTLSGCVNRNVPVLMIHGEDDETIVAVAASNGAAILRSAGVGQVLLRTYPDLGHKMVPQTLSMLIDFIRAKLPVDPPKPTAVDSGPTRAKCGSVVKMNRRGAEPTMDAAGGAETKASPDIAAGRPTPPTNAWDVFDNKSRSNADARVRALMPEVKSLTDPVPQSYPKEAAAAAAAPTTIPTSVRAPAAAPRASPTPTAQPKQLPPSKLPPTPKLPQAGALSSDPDTAAALAAGDQVALQRALAKRGNDSALDEAEMLAIAQLMLGNMEGAEGAAQMLAGLAKENKGGPGPAATVVTKPAEPAFVDSDDEQEGEEEASMPGPTPPTAAYERAAAPSPPPPCAPAGNAPPPGMRKLAIAEDEESEAGEELSYELNELDGQIHLTVRLPDSVTSMTGVDVELAPTTIEVTVKGCRALVVPMAKAVDDEAATAKFVKRAHELRIRVPIA